MSRAVTTRHRLEYFGFRALRGVFRLLPESWALALGEGVGWIAGSIFRIRRRVVAANLALAFPERDARWRRAVARGSYRHLGREAVAMFRLGSRTREWVEAATEVEGLEPLASAVSAGRGGIVVTGHLGSWEMGGAAIAVRGMPVDAVALVQANPLFDRDLVATRERLGMSVVRRGDASRAVLRSLRAGRVPALVADQNARNAPLFVPFFGVAAATFRGPALFALRSGAPLFVGLCVRSSRRPQRYRVVIREVSVPLTDDLEADVARLTEAWVAALEQGVRRDPEQYFWQHKRWKTRPPSEIETESTAIGYHP
ncbi:MAG: lysophospholipid acyltransferase family protein [Gemmatimonadetes bacterium]|nr:lysophospholipid acyltransferase family protein [Gemmatimonadota bacterium]NNK63544.1 lysophospholipid acyltransferase family protein [Gemmatimonadota bacterium]